MITAGNGWSPSGCVTKASIIPSAVLIATKRSFILNPLRRTEIDAPYVETKASVLICKKLSARREEISLLFQLTNVTCHPIYKNGECGAGRNHNLYPGDLHDESDSHSRFHRCRYVGGATYLRATCSPWFRIVRGSASVPCRTQVSPERRARPPLAIPCGRNRRRCCGL